MGHSFRAVEAGLKDREEDCGFQRSNYFQVVQDPAPTLPEERFSAEFNDFIPQCVNKNPNERASYTQLLDHQFLTTHAEVDDQTMGSFIKEILDLAPAAASCDA